MSGQRWPIAIIEREWLALRCPSICRACMATGVGPTPTNGWQLSWPDEQNDIGLTSFLDVGPTKLPTKC